MNKRSQNISAFNQFYQTVREPDYIDQKKRTYGSMNPSQKSFAINAEILTSLTRGKRRRFNSVFLEWVVARNENGLWQKALAGIILIKFKLISDSSKVHSKISLRFLEESNYSEIVYTVYNFFSKNIESEKQEILGKIARIRDKYLDEKFKWFSSSIYDVIIEDSPFLKKLDESPSFTLYEKLHIYSRIDSINEKQIKEIETILDEEKVKIKSLTETEKQGVNSFYIKNWLLEFELALDHFEYDKNTNTAFSQIRNNLDKIAEYVDSFFGNKLDFFSAYFGYSNFHSFSEHNDLRNMPEEIENQSDDFEMEDPEVLNQFLLKSVGRKSNVAELIAPSNAMKIEDSAPFWNDLGVIASSNTVKNYQQAIKAYKKAIQQNPKVAVYWFNLGLAYMKTTKFKLAKMAFQKCVELAPENVKALMYLASIPMDLGKAERKLKLFEMVTQIDPLNYVAFYNKGLILNEIGRNHEALKAIEKSMSLNPNQSANIFYDKAFILIDLERFEEALQCYDLAIASNPEYSEAYYNKAILLQQLKRFNEAFEVLKIGHQNIPDNVDVCHSLGWFYFIHKDLINAKKQFQKTLKLDKNYKHAYVNLGHYELVLGNGKEAVSNYKKSLDFWNYSEEFFDGFDDDFQHIQPYGISEEYYQEIRQELYSIIELPKHFKQH